MTADFTSTVVVQFLPDLQLSSLQLQDVLKQLIAFLPESPYSPEVESLEGFFTDCSSNIRVTGEQKLLALAFIDERRLCGFAQFRFFATESDLDFIIIGSQFRGKGLASLILDQSLVQLRSKGVNRVLLEVSPRNSAALALYHSLGFTELAVRKKYYRNGDDAFIMEKRI